MRGRGNTPASAGKSAGPRAVVCSDLDPIYKHKSLDEDLKRILTTFGDDLKPVRRADALKNTRKVQSIL